MSENMSTEDKKLQYPKEGTTGVYDQTFNPDWADPITIVTGSPENATSCRHYVDMQPTVADFVAKFGEAETKALLKRAVTVSVQNMARKGLEKGQAGLVQLAALDDYRPGLNIGSKASIEKGFANLATGDLDALNALLAKHNLQVTSA